MIGRARRDGVLGIAAKLVNFSRARRQAPLTLAPTRAETRVPFHGFDVFVAKPECVFELVKRDVLTAANHRLAQSVPLVLTTGVTRLEHRDARDLWQFGLQSLPNPSCQVFACGILETGNLVQIPMIERVVQWLPAPVEVGKIKKPARIFVDGTRNRDLNFETMPMKSRALVSFRNTRKTMRRFEPKLMH